MNKAEKMSAEDRAEEAKNRAEEAKNRAEADRLEYINGIINSVLPGRILAEKVLKWQQNYYKSLHDVEYRFEQKFRLDGSTVTHTIFVSTISQYDVKSKSSKYKATKPRHVFEGSRGDAIRVAAEAKKVFDALLKRGLVEATAAAYNFIIRSGYTEDATPTMPIIKQLEPDEADESDEAGESDKENKTRRKGRRTQKRRTPKELHGPTASWP